MKAEERWAERVIRLKLQYPAMLHGYLANLQQHTESGFVYLNEVEY